MAEHSTADREVPSSNPGAPSLFFLSCNLFAARFFFALLFKSTVAHFFNAFSTCLCVFSLLGLQYILSRATVNIFRAIEFT